MSIKYTFDYSAKIADLENILASLQQTDIPLDEAMRLHTEGKKLVEDIEKFLNTAEHKVRKHLAEAE